MTQLRDKIEQAVVRAWHGLAGLWRRPALWIVSEATAQAADHWRVQVIPTATGVLRLDTARISVGKDRSRSWGFIVAGRPVILLLDKRDALLARTITGRGVWSTELRSLWPTPSEHRTTPRPTVALQATPSIGGRAYQTAYAPLVRAAFAPTIGRASPRTRGVIQPAPRPDLRPAGFRRPALAPPDLRPPPSPAFTGPPNFYARNKEHI